MKTMKVFDPPMCCSTGVCGPGPDLELAGFWADLHWLASNGIAVERYNLAQQPQAFAADQTVRSALQEHGNKCLPLILVDGAIVSQGHYPKREELARWTGVEWKSGMQELPVIQTRCCS